MKRLVSILFCGIAAARCAGHSTTPTPPDPFPDGPTIACPAAVSVTSTTGQATAVVYGAALITGGAPPVTPTCTPASESLFPIGTTTVTCTATDSRQRTASCTFHVNVAAPPKLGVTKFVAFGDSMTAGEDGNNISTSVFAPRVIVSSPYPSLLRAALAARYTTQSQLITIRNEGRPGEPLALRSAALPPPAPPRFSSVLAGGQYDIALLMEGANDLQNRDDRDIPPAIAAMQTMVRDARSRGVKVVVATLPPSNPQGRSGLAWSLVPPFNSQLKAMAGAEGVPVADVYAAFGGDTPNFALLGADGLHPNQDGYQKIADAFFQVIKDNFELPPAPTTTFIAPFAVPRPAGAAAPPRRR